MKLSRSLVLISPFLLAGPLHAESHKNLFESVLIVGASVSNQNPSYATHVTTQAAAAKVTRRAKDGAKSSEHADWIEKNIPALRPTLVLGLDLFIHDVKSEWILSAKTKARVKSTVETLCQNATEVYIGNTMPFGIAFAPAELNRFLGELQKTHKNLVIVDIASIYAALNGSGYQYSIDGVSKTYKKKQVLKDHVHPNALGRKLFANEIIKRIRERNPEISAKDLPYLAIE